MDVREGIRPVAVVENGRGGYVDKIDFTPLKDVIDFIGEAVDKVDKGGDEIPSNVDVDGVVVVVVVVIDIVEDGSFNCTLDVFKVYEGTEVESEGGRLDPSLRDCVVEETAMIGVFDKDDNDDKDGEEVISEAVISGEPSTIVAEVVCSGEVLGITTETGAETGATGATWAARTTGGIGTIGAIARPSPSVDGTKDDSVTSPEVKGTEVVSRIGCEI